MAYEVKKVSVVCVIEKDGKYLFLKRSNTGKGDGFYMLPGGHVDAGESVLHAAVRELKEELGIDVKESDLEFKLVEPIKTYITFFFRVKKIWWDTSKYGTRKTWRNGLFAYRCERHSSFFQAGVRVNKK